jgi:hypothetical protein
MSGAVAVMTPEAEASSTMRLDKSPSKATERLHTGEKTVQCICQGADAATLEQLFIACWQPLLSLPNVFSNHF